MTTEKLDIDPGTINRYLAERIAESALGAALAAVIKDEVTKLANRYDNPMKQLVEQHMRTEVARIIRDDYGDLIREKVKAAITDEVVQTVTDAAFDSVIRGARR